jgi:hypothetical protein
MKTVHKIAAGIGAISSLASAAYAQNSDTATATGSATIIQPIAASKVADLAFGTIVKPASGTATVALDATGNRTVTGTVATNNVGVSSASFNVVGEGGSAFSVAVPASFSMTSGSSSLVVSTVDNSNGGGTLSGTIGSASTASFGVGGNFTVNSATTSGAYTGTFAITASYN